MGVKWGLNTFVKLWHLAVLNTFNVTSVGQHWCFVLSSNALLLVIVVNWTYFKPVLCFALFLSNDFPGSKGNCISAKTHLICASLSNVGTCRKLHLWTLPGCLPGCHGDFKALFSSQYPMFCLLWLKFDLTVNQTASQSALWNNGTMRTFHKLWCIAIIRANVCIGEITKALCPCAYFESESP